MDSDDRSYVIINGEEIHGLKKWAILVGVLLAMLVAWALFASPFWLLALAV